jgi:tetratricopeptide (TPR) repeat protein
MTEPVPGEDIDKLCRDYQKSTSADNEVILQKLAQKYWTLTGPEKDKVQKIFINELQKNPGSCTVFRPLELDYEKIRDKNLGDLLLKASCFPVIDDYDRQFFLELYFKSGDISRLGVLSNLLVNNSKDIQPIGNWTYLQETSYSKIQKTINYALNNSKWASVGDDKLKGLNSKELTLLASIYYAQGSFEGAIRVARLALQDKNLSKSWRDEALHALAWSYFQIREKHRQETIKEFENIVNNYPDCIYRSNAMIRLGEQYQLAGRDREALTVLGKMRKEYPNHPEISSAFMGMFKTWRDVGPEDIISNVGDFSAILKDTNRERRYNAVQGLYAVYFNAGRKKELLPLFKKMMEITPYSEEYDYYKNNYYALLKENDPTIKVPQFNSDDYCRMMQGIIDGKYSADERPSIQHIIRQSPDNRVIDMVLMSLDTATSSFNFELWTGLTGIGSYDPFPPNPDAGKYNLKARYLITNCLDRMPKMKTAYQYKNAIFIIRFNLLPFIKDTVYKKECYEKAFKLFHLIPSLQEKDTNVQFCLGGNPSARSSVIESLKELLSVLDSERFSTDVKTLVQDKALYAIAKGQINEYIIQTGGKEIYSFVMAEYPNNPSYRQQMMLNNLVRVYPKLERNQQLSVKKLLLDGFYRPDFETIGMVHNLFSIEAISHDADIKEAMVKELESSKRPVLSEVIEGLGKTGDKSLIPVLRKFQEKYTGKPDAGTSKESSMVILKDKIKEAIDRLEGKIPADNTTVINGNNVIMGGTIEARY